MKIQFIGTGSITAKENPACLLIDDHILVDCGNGIVKALLKENIDIFAIDTLLITHLHGDHFVDLPFLILPRSFTPVSNTLRILCPSGTEEAVRKLTELIYSDVEPLSDLCSKGQVVFEEFEAEEEMKAGDYSIRSIPVDHGNFSPSYGFLISDGKHTLGVSGDSTLCEGVEIILQETDAAVLDCSFPEANASHMGSRTLLELSEKYDVILAATHMTPNSRSILKEANKTKIIIPSDYDILNI